MKPFIDNQRGATAEYEAYKRAGTTTMKLCKDCKHYKDGFTYARPCCGHPSAAFSQVNGKALCDASTARSFESMCGSNAKRFEAWPSFTDMLGDVFARFRKGKPQ